MAQFSVKIIRLNGAVLDENQQLPLKEQFERDPYGLTQTELNMLNDHYRRNVQRRKQD